MLSEKSDWLQIALEKLMVICKVKNKSTKNNIN